MFLDKPLRTSLLFSTILHLALFLPLRFWGRHPVESLPELQIKYLAVQEEPAQEPELKLDQPVQVVQSPVLPPRPETAVNNTTVTEPQKISEKPKENVEIPPELPKKMVPFFLDYNQTIRSKIYRVVLKNYPRFIGIGEVHLYFTLSNDGKLKEIRIIEEKSTRDQRLRQIVVKSIQEAAPFLAFPQELNQATLSFNLTISFELEE